MSSGTASERRRAFEADRPFRLDRYQIEALDALDAGQSVLVAAPTGSGKTLVAEYALAGALAIGAKAFYTTPLKALSNQKFADLTRAHGPAQVGLLTGDNSINGDAPIVVMTTEVLRNMIYAGSETLAGLRYVILDEVHYLQNPYRGAVWEEVIIHLAAEVDLVCLSATVSNAEEFAAWVQTVRGETRAVIEERRPVELQNLYLVGERGTDDLHLLPTFVRSDTGEPRPNPEASRLDSPRVRSGGRRPTRRLRTPGRVETVARLTAADMLPAIEFVFSRAGCDQAVDQCLAAGVRLTDRDEASEIQRIAEAHTARLAGEDLRVLGYGAWLAALVAGVSAHHAGMVPPMKEAVEEAFAAGLVKMVFATETLSLGINMPARTVVIEKLSKFTGERHEFLTPGEYTQLTGRAGRRGIDETGYAVVCWSPFVPFDQVAGLASRRTHALRSSFRPTYNMAANLVRRYDAAEAHHLLNLSFAQFHADRDVVSLERQLERSREELAHLRADAEQGAGDIDEYLRLAGALDAERRPRDGGRQAAAALEALRPGDVVVTRGRRGKVVVLAHDRGRRGAPRVLALTTGRELVRLGVEDFDGPPAPATRVELPEPHAPRSVSFRRAAAERLRRVKVGQSARARARARPDTSSELAGTVAAHPVTRDPHRDRRVRAATSATRLERDVARLERRVRSRTESLARQFDRVLRVLEAWGYVEGWALTDAGELLARLYTETDLLLAEGLREGLLDGLDPPQLAAVVSCFTYERRGPDSDRPPPPRWPSREVAARTRTVERIWQELTHNEDDAGLPETRGPDPGFAPFLHDWVAGDDLETVLGGDDEITGGDFVRTVKQCVDLLRQLADVAPDPETARAASRAADACVRGVVAASSVVGR